MVGTYHNLYIGISCPKLMVAGNPACQGLYVYYKMTAGEVDNGNQNIIDSSGNDRHGTNGSSQSDNNQDCTPYDDGIYFNGSCRLKLPNLTLSPRGFTLQMDIKYDSGA